MFVADSRGYGGAEAYIWRLIRALDERYTFSLLAPASASSAMTDAVVAAGGRLFLAPEIAGKQSVPSIIGLAHAIRQARPDLIHLNLTEPANCRYATALGPLVAPSIATMHAIGGSRSVVQRVNLRLAFSRVAHMIAVSGEIAEAMEARLRLPAQKITTVPNGVAYTEQTEIRPDPAPLKVGAAGRHTDLKGFDVLIESVRILVDRGVAIEVVIAGDGPERGQLEQRAAGLPITFPGWLDDVDPWLRTLDVFCLPSRWEGLPFMLLEAMAHGLPSVATPVGDIALTLGQACALTPVDDPDALADALASLLPYDRRLELGAAGRTFVQLHHSVERMASLTEAVYANILSAERQFRPLGAAQGASFTQV
jgi:glycosyltransferase involved in cell wall biosynthesis